jgi:hypothetical protein
VTRNGQGLERRQILISSEVWDSPRASATRQRVSRSGFSKSILIEAEVLVPKRPKEFNSAQQQPFPSRVRARLSQAYETTFRLLGNIHGDRHQLCEIAALVQDLRPLLTIQRTLKSELVQAVALDCSFLRRSSRHHRSPLWTGTRNAAVPDYIAGDLDCAASTRQIAQFRVQRSHLRNHSEPRQAIFSQPIGDVSSSTRTPQPDSSPGRHKSLNLLPYSETSHRIPPDTTKTVSRIVNIHSRPYISENGGWSSL